MPTSRIPAFVARHRTAVVVGTGLGLLVAVQAIVLPVFPASSATIVPTGRLLASNCMQCHGTNGMDGGFDQLAGESVDDFIEKMKDQQSHSSIMGAQARGFSDAELRQIASYFASLPKP
jgi:cytochrome subunit of sulfide dehydrogenase